MQQPARRGRHRGNRLEERLIEEEVGVGAHGTEGCQRQETGVSCSHSPLALMAQVLAPCWHQLHAHMFEGSQLEGLYVRELMHPAREARGESNSLSVSSLWFLMFC